MANVYLLRYPREKNVRAYAVDQHGSLQFMKAFKYTTEKSFWNKVEEIKDFYHVEVDILRHEYYF